MHVIWGKSFFVSVDKKMISPHNEWYIGNVHIFFQNLHMVPIVYALLHSYLDF